VTPSSSGRLQALMAAVLFSTGGAALKTEAFTALQVSGLRSAIAAIVLMLWIRRPLTLSRTIVAGSLMYAATVTLFVLATRWTTAANAIFLQSSAPLALILLGPWLLDERFRRRDIPFLVALAAGMWLAVAGAPSVTRTAPDPTTGNLAALASSLTWALTLASLRLVERDPSRQGAGLSMVVLGNAIAAAIAVPTLWPLPSAATSEWLTVLYLGVCQIALAYVLLTAAMRHLPAVEASLLLLVEPVLNPAWTWLVRGEQPGVTAIAGGAVILIATAFRTLLLNRSAR